MPTFTCTRCGGSGFLNLEQVDDATLKRFDETGDKSIILAWIDDRNAKAAEYGGCYCAAMRMPPCSYCTDYAHDVDLCDCCDGSGQHDWDNPDDPKGCR